MFRTPMTLQKASLLILVQQQWSSTDLSNAEKAPRPMELLIGQTITTICSLTSAFPPRLAPDAPTWVTSLQVAQVPTIKTSRQAQLMVLVKSPNGRVSSPCSVTMTTKGASANPGLQRMPAASMVPLSNCPNSSTESQVSVQISNQNNLLSEILLKS